jgi:hypothetical protein
VQLRGPESNPQDKQQKQVDKMEDKVKPGPAMTEEQKNEWANIGPPQSHTSRINASRKHDHPGRHR